MRRRDSQEETEKEELVQFERAIAQGQYGPLENWFHTTDPWETSLTFGLVMLQLTTEQFKGQEWWDTWAATWVLVHRNERVDVLASGIVSPIILQSAKLLAKYDEYRERDALRQGRRKDKPYWHILGQHLTKDNDE